MWIDYTNILLLILTEENVHYKIQSKPKVLKKRSPLARKIREIFRRSRKKIHRQYKNKFARITTDDDNEEEYVEVRV